MITGPWYRSPYGVLVVGTLAAALLATCDGRPRITRPVVVDTLPSGTIRVLNRVPSDREGREVTAIETLLLGSVDDASRSFTTISGLAVSPDGTIYAVDHGTRELRAFDRRGRRLWKTGAEGGGPGQFRDPWGLGVLPTGDLLVVDPGNGRYDVFDADGHYLRSHPRHQPTAIPWPGAVLRNGAIIDVAAGGYVIVDLTRAVHTPLRIPAYAPPTYDVARPGGILMRLHVPYSPQLELGLGPAAVLWVGISRGYEIMQSTLAGDTLREVLLARPAPVIGPRTRAWLRDGFAADYGAVDLSRVPARMPAYKALIVDDLDRLWVAPFTPEEEHEGAAFDPYGNRITTFDVFDARGHYQYRVRLPRTLMAAPRPVVRAGAVYGITRDALDVQFVVRLAVPAPTHADGT